MQIISRKEALDQALTHYFTGKLCKNGHIDVRFSKDGSCKSCSREKRMRLYRSNPESSKAISNKWKQENKSAVAAYTMIWRNANSDHLSSYGRNYREKNRDLRLAQKEEWRKNNMKKVREYARNRYSTNISHKLNHKIRSMVARVISRGSSSSIPYTADDLRKRLEVQFKPGMSWGNYGEWEIDHKIPISRFISKGVKSPSIINALSNLQPLWKSENRSKNNRYPW